VRIATFRGAGSPLAIEEAPDPTPTSDGIVVRVERCGICGSDVSMTSGGAFDYPVGSRIGHEYSGEIVAIGREVSGLRIGGKVACNPTGLEALGGFGEYVTLGARGAIPLPAGLSMSDGALVEPMACGVHSLRMANMQPGSSVVVLGAGSMALAIVWWARRMNAGRIVVASRSVHRTDILHTFGADVVHGFGDDDTDMIAREIGGADIVAECVGKPGMLERSLGLVRPGGTVMSMGMCSSGDRVVPYACALKEVRMLFPVGFTDEEYRETVDAIAADDVHADRMVSDVIGLDEVPATLEALRGGELRSLKIHIDPGKAADELKENR
jgi:(R,R)-butanediol dehydrogenase/meso-butanediol dehydrogenase/diacetyl reductase